MKKLSKLLIWLVPCGMWAAFLLMSHKIGDDLVHEVAVALSVMGAGAALLMENAVAAACVQVFCAAVICVAAPGYISFVPVTLMLCGLGLLRRAKENRAFVYAAAVIQLLCFGAAVCSFAGIVRGEYSFNLFEARRALELKYDILFVSIPVLFVVMSAVCLASEIRRKKPKSMNNKKKKNADQSGVSSYSLLLSGLCVSHYLVSAIICIAFLLNFYYTNMKDSSNFQIVFLPWLVFAAVSVTEPLVKRNSFANASV